VPVSIAARVTALVLAALAASGASEAAEPGCDVVGDVAATDRRRALEACGAAQERFAELFGAPVPEVVIYLEDRSGYRTGVRGGRAILVWPTTRAMVGRLSGPRDAVAAHVAEQWRDVLPHEIAHVLLAARFFRDGARSPGYGTPFPDWFDEGVAIWAESPAQREARLAQARALPEELRALSGILGSAHPAARDASILRIRDGAAIPDDEALWTYYPRSIAVVAFVFETGGQAAMRALAERMLADPDGPVRLEGLPGFPATAGEVEALWEAWMRRGAVRPGGRTPAPGAPSPSPYSRSSPYRRPFHSIRRPRKPLRTKIQAATSAPRG